MKKSLILLLLAIPLAVVGYQASGLADAEQTGPSQRVFMGLAHSGESVFAVGEEGVIRFSDDNAANWHSVSSGVEHTLTAIEFASEKRGWAVGHNGVVLQTANGGRNWQPVHVATEEHQGPALMDVVFGKDQMGLIVGDNNLIFATRDGGESWYREVYEAGRYPSAHNAALLLDSGHALIATGAGEILVRAPGENQWSRKYGPDRKALLGMVDLGSDRVLAFGAHGQVLETMDAGATWSEVETTSSANYLAGARLGDGSVVLVGSEGMVARRKVGEAMFLQEEQLPPGALTGVVEGQNGRLLVTGAQGVGFLVDEDYHFDGMDEANPYTGYLLTKALLHRPEMIQFLGLTTSSFRRSFGEVPDDRAAWVSVSVSATSETEDVLTPAVFHDIHQLHSDLSEQRELGLLRVKSLWSEDHTHIVIDRSTGTHHRVVSQRNDYNEDERPYLERRMLQAGMVGNYISEDSRTMILQAEVDLSKEQNGDLPAALASFFKDYQAGFDEQSPGYTMVKLEYVTIEKLYDQVPGTAPDTTNDKKAVGAPPQYIYEIGLKAGEPGNCSQAEAVRLSSYLEDHLTDARLDADVFSVAKLAKYNKVAWREGNWKGFAADGYEERYRGGVHLLWERSSCVNPLAVVIGRSGAQNVAERINTVLAQFEQAKGLAGTDASLNLNTYRITRSAL